MESIFTKIIQKKIPAEILYQDELVTAFKDINPRAPTHILIVPNICIPTVDDIEEEHAPIIGKMFLVAKMLAKKMNINSSGYRLIINCKENGGQEVYHLHMHLLGGKYLGPMVSQKN